MRVLDKGFVELVDFMGGDLRVVQTARVSTGSQSKGDEEDKKLLNYLMKEGHHSPFEFSTFCFHIKCPIFVARQWFRHRISSYCEKSGRYTEFDKSEYYIPEQPRIQEKVNKQGSEFSDQFTEEDIIDLHGAIVRVTEESLHTYRKLLGAGIAKELARIILPLNMYTEFYWNINARSLMNFLKLRLDKHAQLEIRLYAQVMEKIFEEKMPWTAEAFRRYILHEEETPRV